MKLCKDCKYSPGVLEYANCNHPDAERSVINGASLVSMTEMRGRHPMFGRTNRSLCEIDAKLFEERPPEKEPEPFVWSEPTETKRYSGFWQLFGFGK